MASPNHKKSKMRKRQRVAQLEKPILANVSVCPECGAAKKAHCACPKCGVYNGRKVTSAASAEK